MHLKGPSHPSLPPTGLPLLGLLTKPTVPVGPGPRPVCLPALPGHCGGCLSPAPLDRPRVGEPVRQPTLGVALHPARPRPARRAAGTQTPGTQGGWCGEPAGGHPFPAKSPRPSRDPAADPENEHPAQGCHLLPLPLLPKSQRKLRAHPAPSSPGLQRWPRQPPPSHHPPAFVTSEPGLGAAARWPC